MKKIILIVTMALISKLGAQEHFSGRNELRFNPTFLFNTNSLYPEFSYERALGEKSAVGLSVGFMIGSNDVGGYVNDLFHYDFSALSYYRYYLGKESLSGFFLEGNGIIVSGMEYLEDETEWEAGLGFGIGAKFPLRNSWNIDFVIGGGGIFEKRDDENPSTGDFVIDLNFPSLYPRLGITIGKRF